MPSDPAVGYSIVGRLKSLQGEDVFRPMDLRIFLDVDDVTHAISGLHKQLPDWEFKHRQHRLVPSFEEERREIRDTIRKVVHGVHAEGNKRWAVNPHCWSCLNKILSNEACQVQAVHEGLSSFESPISYRYYHTTCQVELPAAPFCQVGSVRMVEYRPENSR